ncbi:hypothetical protein [Neptuniibacter halophilus]|uniref:hypothetical protein n=1 Tax=Neptuniibacter halophilus TaxID=651666 RepID=UPI0025744857|nr:hypothetical protein [Neptuniibacter halophilus]
MKGDQEVVLWVAVSLFTFVMGGAVMSEIDWTLIKDLITTVCAIGALLIAVSGLSTWKSQLKGTSEYELAKKIMLLTYELQQEFGSVRNPMLRYSWDKSQGLDAQINAEMEIYQNRLNSMHGKWAELQSARLEAKVIWGEESYASFKGLETVVRELHVAVTKHFRLMRKTGERWVDQRIENEKILYTHYDDNETFAKTIYKAVSDIESYFQTRMR